MSSPRKAPWICSNDDCMFINKPEWSVCSRCKSDREDGRSVHDAKSNERIKDGRVIDLGEPQGGPLYSFNDPATQIEQPHECLTQHGHVTPVPGGWKARCGGPGFCSGCDREFVVFHKQRSEAAGKALMDAATGVDVAAAVALFAQSHTLRNVLLGIGQRLGVTFMANEHVHARVDIVEGDGDMHVQTMYVRDENGVVSLLNRPLADAPAWVIHARQLRRDDTRDLQLAELVKQCVKFRTELDDIGLFNFSVDYGTELLAAIVPFLPTEISRNVR